MLGWSMPVWDGVGGNSVHGGEHYSVEEVMCLSVGRNSLLGELSCTYPGGWLILLHMCKLPHFCWVVTLDRWTCN